MKILLLGATGKVGSLILTSALEKGHDVLALVRNPAKITVKNVLLTVKPGNVKDGAELAAAMAGVDAIISALGHNSLDKSEIQTVTTRLILEHIKPGQRVISLTGQGVTDPKDPPLTLATRLVTAGIKLVPGQMYQDGADHAQLLRDSSADWVLVRSPVMTSGPATSYRTGYFKIGFKDVAHRLDVANFMLACAMEDTWLRQAPLIASA